jgi:outer membrane protein assembly factor BamB
MTKYNKISGSFMTFTLLLCIFIAIGTVNATDIENNATGPTVTSNLTSGIYNTAQTVALLSNDSSAIIYYSNDTTDPRNSSTRITYTGPISITSTTTLRYAAVDSLGNWSQLYLQNYVIGNGGPVNNTGQSNYVGPQTKTPKWTYNLKTEVFGSPVIGSDGTVYIGTLNGPDHDGDLYAFNPDGTLKWKYHTYGVMGAPTIGSDGTIYVGGHWGMLYAFNPNGTVKWTFDIYFSDTGNIKTEGNLWDRTIYSSPAVGADGTIYIATYNGDGLYAINPDGTLKWKYRISNVMYSTPAIGSDGTIYLGDISFTFYAINPDGTLKWKYNANSQIYGSPAIGSDGTIYVGISGTFGSKQGQLIAFNPDGSIKWTYLADGEIWEDIKIGSDGTLYFGTRDGMSGNGTYGIDRSFYAVNPDGTLKWKYKINGAYITGYFIGADGIIYVGSSDFYENGDLYAFTPDGTVKWIYTAGGSPAIGADGSLYFGSRDGNFYAIKDPAKITITATPAGGIYSSKNVVLTASETHFSAVYYTTDGSDPRTSSTKIKYTDAIPINTTTTLKFAAVDLINNKWSPVYNETYTIDNTAPTSSANINGGLYNTNKVVYLRISEAGTIYYTLNGSIPTTSSTRYTGPLTISSTTTLRWIAVDLAGNTSPVYTQKYTIDKIAPRIMSTSPRNYATRVSRTSTIAIKFNKNIKWSIYASKIKVLNKYGRTVSIRKWISGNTLYIKTTYKRLSYSYYRVYIPYAALKDYAGNQFRTGYSFRFKTGRY